MRSYLIALLAIALVVGTSVPAAAEAQLSPVRLRDKRKLVNEVVTVHGITGKKLDDISRSTRLYTLVDDFGDSVKVRTSQDWPPIGVTFRVTGTIIFDGRLRDYVLVEAQRVQLGGAEATPGTLGGVSPSPQTRVAPTAGTGKAKKREISDTLLIAGVGLIIIASIVLMLLASSARRRRRAEMRRRQREEAERARALLAAPPTGTGAPFPVAPPGGTRAETVATGVPQPAAESPSAAIPAARGTTVEAWGKLALVEGPGAGVIFPLMGNKTVIGRDPSADIALTSDETISRSHGTIVRTADGRLLFIDESRNGSRVSGRLVHMSQVEIASGARIQVGMTTLELTDFRVVTPSSAAGPAAAGAPTVEVPLTRQPTMQVPATARPSAQPRAEVVVLRGPDADRRFPIVKHTVTIGRLDDRDIQLTDPMVSRKHATLSFDGEAFILQNEGAAGTVVDGERIDRIRLTGTEQITIGESVLRIEVEVAGR